MKRTVFFNGVELTEPEAIEAALRHAHTNDLVGRPPTLEELRGEYARNGAFPEDSGPDPIMAAIDREFARVFSR